MFLLVLEYINECKNNTTLLTSIYHGEMWNFKELKKNGFILPIILFFDDLEINNLLRSRKSINKN